MQKVGDVLSALLTENLLCGEAVGIFGFVNDPLDLLPAFSYLATMLISISAK
jgi:hypothetical protein